MSDDYVEGVSKNPAATTGLFVQPETWDAFAPLFPQLTKLERLTFAMTAPREWPAALFELPRLKHLEIKAKALDEQVRRLPHLESLAIEGSQGQFWTEPLPDWLWKLRLKRLDLVYFALQKFPEALLEMTSLEELDFQRAGHGDHRLRVPPEITRLTRLQKLALCLVDVKGIPFESFGDLQELELSYARIERLPEDFGALRKLTQLKIEYSELAALPDSIGGCKALKHLTLAKLPLTELPAGMGQLGELRSIWIRETPLQALPELLGRCRNLERIWATETKMTEVPKAIVSLPKLEDLRLGGNYFSPEGYKALESALKNRTRKIVEPGMPRRGRAPAPAARTGKSSGARDLAPAVLAQIKRLGLEFKEELPVEEEVAGVKYELSPPQRRLLGIKYGPEFVFDLYEEGENKKADFPDYSGSLDEFECIHHHPYVSVGSYEWYQQVLVRLDDTKPEDPYIYVVDLSDGFDRTDLGHHGRLSEWLKALRPAPKAAKE